MRVERADLETTDQGRVFPGEKITRMRADKKRGVGYTSSSPTAKQRKEKRLAARVARRGSRAAR